MKKVLILLVLAFSIGVMAQNKPTFTRAAIMSEEFVKPKMKYPEEVKFSGDRRGSEKAMNEYEVFQKFTAKNSFGVKSGYVYKIRMIYRGGDWTEKSSWKYQFLIIEDESTGKQTKYSGNITPQ